MFADDVQVKNEDKAGSTTGGVSPGFGESTQTGNTPGTQGVTPTTPGKK